MFLLGLGDLGRNQFIGVLQVTGARLVGVYNGRAVISLARNKGESTVSVASKGIPTVFLKGRVVGRVPHRG